MNNYDKAIDESVRLANIAKIKNEQLKRENQYFVKQREIEKEKKKKTAIENFKRKTATVLISLLLVGIGIEYLAVDSRVKEQYGEYITAHSGSSNSEPESYYIIDGEKIPAFKIYLKEYLEFNSELIRSLSQRGGK